MINFALWRARRRRASEFHLYGEGEVENENNSAVIPQQRQGVKEEILWERRFFHLGEFFSNLAQGEGVPRAPRTCLYCPGKRYNKLPILIDIEDRRTIRVFKKIRSGGYFNIPVVLNSKTFHKYFALDREGMLSSGGDNAEGKSTNGAATSGDEGESRHSQDEQPRSDHSQDSSIEYIGTIRRSDRIISRLFNQVLLLILGAKFEKAHPNGGGRAKDVSSATKSTPAAKGVVIGKKHLREEASNVLLSEAPAAKRVVIGKKHLREKALNVSLSEAKSKGKEALPPPMAKKAKSATSSMPVTKGAKPSLAPKEGTSISPGNALGPRASMLGSASVFEKICRGLFFRPTRRRSISSPWTRDIGSEATFQITRAESVEIEMKKATEELKEKSDLVVRSKEKVAEMKKNKVLAKKKAMEEYKQLAHHHPNLGIDLDNMGLDHDLLEEEEEEKAEEKGEDKEEENKEG
ncbi:hypothetical protein Acr_07g0013860 [Actinidia rufa]|uniref:Uncharacterized protein n=1 Tax=Actinidia rufa TaxID=165716 RepID=A0A7J0EXP5_9ERIC|nr:hypothetical protein Acr_07g0013860 [Actinidia rufa]